MGASRGLVRGAAKRRRQGHATAVERVVSKFRPIVSSRRRHCLQPRGCQDGAKRPRGGARNWAQSSPANARGGPFLAIFWRHYGDNGPSPRCCLQQKSGPKAANLLILLDKTGAGEGIRTLDPNLGKVVLYP